MYVTDEERKFLCLHGDFIGNKLQTCINHLQEILFRDKSRAPESAGPNDKVKARVIQAGYPNDHLYGSDDLYPNN